MSYLGNFKAGTPVRFQFNTKTAAGAAITLAGTPAVSVYKLGSTTEFTTGVTLTVDYDSKTGLHQVDIVTTDPAYETGADYSVVLTAGTVDGTSVANTALRTFSIENRFAVETDADGNALSNVQSLADIPVTISGDGDSIALVLPTGGGFTFPASAAVLSSLTQTQVTGGAYALSTDANGRIRLVSGSGTGELDFTSGVVKANTVQVLGTAVDASPTPLDVNVTQIDGATVDASGSGTITFTRGATVSTLTPAQVNTEADAALADAGYTSARAGYLDSLNVASLATRLGTLPTSGTVTITTDIPSANANADALLDRANGIETGWTFRQTARVMLAVLAGKSSNDGATFRDVGDTKARVTATVDSNGNRTAVTTDAT